MRLSLYGSTHVGRHRDHNEDSYLIIYESKNKWVEANNLEIDLSLSKGVVCVVADGMGGANAGEVASSIAINTVKELFGKLTSFPETISEVHKLFDSIIQEGHNRIIKSSKHTNSLQGMGTTIVIGCFIKDILHVAWSGDSRCYVHNKEDIKELQPFTNDHSLVWERVMSNEISPEEARLSEDSNLILQSLGGASQKPKPEFKWVKLKDTDRVLFCSDGLNSMLSNVGIQQILDFNASPEETCETLIQAANNAGGKDNITSIVIDVYDVKENSFKSGNYDTVTASDRQKKIKRRNLYIFLFLILLIVTSGIIFRSEVVIVFKSLFTVKPTPEITDLNHQNDSIELDSNESFVISTPEISDSLKANDLVIVKTAPIISNNNILDSSYIETHLRTSADKISYIKNTIIWHKPGNKIGSSPAFWDEVKPELDSILTILGRQEEMIKEVAIITQDNKLVMITDYFKANSIFKEIGDTINDLENKRKEILDPH